MNEITEKPMSKVRFVIMHYGGYKEVARMFSLKTVSIRKWCTDGVSDIHQAQFRELAAKINIVMNDDDLNYPDDAT